MFLITDSMYYVAFDVLIKILEGLSTSEPKTSIYEIPYFYGSSKEFLKLLDV